jgi:hypothetical protein
MNGCSADRQSGQSERDGETSPLRPRVAAPTVGTTVVAGEGPSGLAVAASATLFEHAPIVLLAAEGDLAAQARAASVAVATGLPLLLPPADEAGASSAAVSDELARLDSDAVLAFGDPAIGWAQARAGDGSAFPTVVPAPTAPGELSALTGRDLGSPEAVGPDGLTYAAAALGRDRPRLLTIDAEPAAPAAGTASAPDGRTSGDLPAVAAAAPLDSVLVLVGRAPSDLAAAATARASGAEVIVTSGDDPRAEAAVIEAMADGRPESVVAMGSRFGPTERLRQRLDVAATGVQLPGGGQLLFPGRRMTALYGHPGTPALGVLGEQPVDEAIARAQRLAADYQGLVDEPVVPAFEIIATVASSAAGPDGNYSAEAAVADLRPWIDAAGQAGTYVVLDLQPGRTDFLTQARRYEELLAQPHVGLALDPEWRLAPDQRHLNQIGSVGADEVNAVATWLADLTRERRLPQKLLMLHQFHVSMLDDRARIDASRDELAVLIHADGFGTAGQKFATWNALHVDPPANIRWGWKNFHDEDQPMFTPGQTVAVTPSPVFVSYQ